VSEHKDHNRAMTDTPSRGSRRPGPGTAKPPTQRAPQAAAPARSQLAAGPLVEADIDTLQALLDQVPAPLEPLDVSMLDGFLCGVLLQPDEIPVSHWFPHVCDADGRALPPRFNATRLHALVMRRHGELRDAIRRREWFDPWVFELSDEPSDAVGNPSDDADEGEDDFNPDQGAVYPWVAGFAAAMECFPALMQADAAALTEPLALLYRHLDPDDLEDADALLEEIDSLEPPADLTEAVEGLVRATLLLADISQPQPTPPVRRGPPRGGPRSAPPRRR
jgi:uncharacterized protein